MCGDKVGWRQSAHNKNWLDGNCLLPLGNCCQTNPQSNWHTGSSGVSPSAAARPGSFSPSNFDCNFLWQPNTHYFGTKIPPCFCLLSTSAHLFVCPKRARWARHSSADKFSNGSGGCISIQTATENAAIIQSRKLLSSKLQLHSCICIPHCHSNSFVRALTKYECQLFAMH